METTQRSCQNEPWHHPWPESSLEWVDSCPVCGCKERILLHTDIVDDVFRVAPGKWSLLQCRACRSAYLNPRPDFDAISMAYTNYYTHNEQPAKEKFENLSVIRKIRRVLANGYTNFRFFTKDSPSNKLGVCFAYAMSGMRKGIDRKFRHLPKRRQGGVLLDLGCGDGSYLRLIRDCGWEVVGLDPDFKVVSNALSHGLKVYQGDINYFFGKSELFDLITLNHVIEHVHCPPHVLKMCYELLKPGGQIWIETPNINSFGHAHFQKYWRGIETPRHLILFNADSLKMAMRTAGFSNLKMLNCPDPIENMFLSSLSLKTPFSSKEQVVTSPIDRLCVKYFKFRNAINGNKREFLTYSGIKSIK